MTGMHQTHKSFSLSSSHRNVCCHFFRIVASCHLRAPSITWSNADIWHVTLKEFQSCNAYTLILHHWGWILHICIGKLCHYWFRYWLLAWSAPAIMITIIWIKARILLIRPLGTNFSEIWIKIHTLSFKKMYWKCRQQNGSHFVLASMC